MSASDFAGLPPSDYKFFEARSHVMLYSVFSEPKLCLVAVQ